MRKCYVLLFVYAAFWCCGASLAQSTQDNVNRLWNEGFYGVRLQSMFQDRAQGIAPQNRPYIFNGVQDCYGYTRQVWNAILYDSSVHPEDYHPYPYNRARWHNIAGGLPVGTYVDYNWVGFSSPDQLCIGDVLGTVQGHRGGGDVHYGMYDGYRTDGYHYQFDCTTDGYGSGAYNRLYNWGWYYYYQPLHSILARSSTPAVGTNSDGRLVVFMRGTNNLMHYCWQNTVNGSFGGWSWWSGPVTGNPVVINQQNNQLLLFCRGWGGDIVLRKQSNNWASWESLGGIIYGDPAVGRSQDGRVEVFCRGTTGAIYKKYQVTQNGGFTSVFDDMGGQTDQSPAVCSNQDGREEIFIRWRSGANNAADNGKAAHKWQLTPNGGWNSSWGLDMGGYIRMSPYVILHSDGRIYQFVRGTNDRVYWMRQTAPNSGWTGWSELGTLKASSMPAACINSNGTLQLFIRGSNNQLYTNRFSNGSWTGWTSLGGVVTSDPAAAKYQDGRMIVFVRGDGGCLHYRVQTTASGTDWTPWTTLGDTIPRF